MKKTYLVKKNPNMPESEDNWIMMNGFEFARFMETPEGQRRKDNFGQLDSCGDNDSIFVIECGKSKAAEWRADKDAHDYLTEQEIASGITTISYNSLCVDDDGEEVSGDDLIADPDGDVFAEVINKINHEKLVMALKSLEKDEYDLVFEMYMSGQEKSEREMADLLNISCVAVHKRKKKILSKIKKYF